MRKKPFSGNFVGALIWWLLSAAWVMVLFYFSGQDGADSSQLSGNLARWLLDRMPFLNLAPAVFEHYLRKTAHLDMGIETAGALAGALAGSLACWMAESLRVRRAYGELTRRQKERK